MKIMTIRKSGARSGVNWWNWMEAQRRRDEDEMLNWFFWWVGGAHSFCVGCAFNAIIYKKAINDLIFQRRERQTTATSHPPHQATEEVEEKDKNGKEEL